MKKNLVYIGNFSFPKNNSAGIRVLNNGYLFRSIGYNTHFIGLSKTTPNKENLELSHAVYDGFNHYAFAYPKKSTEWMFFKNQLKQSIDLIKKINPEIVVAYGSISNSLFVFFLHKWCRSKNIKFVNDCVDWLSGGSGGFLFRVGKHIDTELHKRYINSLGDGAITVSSFLSTYYSKKGCNTLILPPLWHQTKNTEISQDRKKGKPIKIIYAGYPFPVGRKIKNKSFFKDRLDLSIEILSSLVDIDYIFNIFGISRYDYLKTIPEHAELLENNKNKIIFHGAVENRVIIKEISDSDYFILLRDSNKMTNAGFPSKIVEAVSLGTSVITTNTSDLSSYIKSEENGHIISSKNKLTTTKEIRDIFEKSQKSTILSKSQWPKENPFNTENFKEKTTNFFNTILTKKEFT